MKVAFIGLGVMGYPMAGHVLRAGLEICVFNRNAVRAEQWCAEYEGDVAPTPAEAAKNADVVLVCVGNDDDAVSYTHLTLPTTPYV